MKKFNDFLKEKAFLRPVAFPSVSVTLPPHTLSIRFDSKDTVLEAGYAGVPNPWLSSLCFLIEGKSLNELSLFTWSSWEENFKNDQSYWDCRQEVEEEFIHPSLELLKAALTIYRGSDYLYKESSPLVCRCFGVRESDVKEQLQKVEVLTIEAFAEATKAGMGCRSCVPQLNRWLALEDTKQKKHFFKDRAAAEWILDIDYHLSQFPKSKEWKMELHAVKEQQVLISYEKDVSQKEEEIVGQELQDFLGSAVDRDFAFFLRRARHFSKARG